MSSDGLPDKEYNEGLADFDDDIISFAENNNFGLIVLVETFSGNRSYYMYVIDDFSLSAFGDYIDKQYPDQQVKLDERRDKDASFIQRYGAAHF